MGHIEKSPAGKIGAADITGLSACPAFGPLTHCGFSDIRLRRRYRASWQATYGNRQSERIDRLIGARVRLFPPLLVQSFYRGPSSHQKRQKRTLLFAERVSELIRLALAHYKFVLSIPKPFADVSRLIYQMILTFY